MHSSQLRLRTGNALQPLVGLWTFRPATAQTAPLRWRSDYPRFRAMKFGSLKLFAELLNCEASPSIHVHQLREIGIKNAKVKKGI
jgi:hypothetical protein